MKKNNQTVLSTGQMRELICAWQNFYRDLFGIEVDFSNLRIPEKKEGFDRLIIVAQGMTPGRLYSKCKELFSCWKRADKSLDEVITHSDRTAKDCPYAIWIRDRVEADEELKNLSADQLKKQKITGITLEERLLYELKYFKEIGKHLDVVNMTLCSGSRYSGGVVPRVYWYDNKLKVNYFSSNNVHETLCSRQTVFSAEDGK